MKKRLFIDMDGTITRFHDEEDYLKRMYESGFFLGLKPFESVVAAIKLFSRCNPGVEVHILSSIIPSETCAFEKINWIKKYLPHVSNIILVPCGIKKTDYVSDISAYDVLLDDYNKNLVEWKLAGGTAVKLVNNINHKGRYGALWQYDLISYEENPFAICKKLNGHFYCYPDLLLRHG